MIRLPLTVLVARLSPLDPWGRCEAVLVAIVISCPALARRFSRVILFLHPKRNKRVPHPALHLVEVHPI